MEEDGRGAGARPGGLSAAGIGVAAFAVVCCAAGPLLLAVAGGLAVAAWLGIGTGLLVVAAAVVAILTRRRRRACPPGPAVRRR